MVAAAFSKPIPLTYSWSETAVTDVEPRTGAMVSLPSRTEQLSVQPDVSALAALAPVFLAHASDPVVAKLISVASAPAQPIFEIAYAGSPASTATVVNLVRGKAGELRLARVYIPRGLTAVGILVALFGVIAVRRRPRPAQPSGHPIAVEEPEPAKAA